MQLKWHFPKPLGSSLAGFQAKVEQIGVGFLARCWQSRQEAFMATLGAQAVIGPRGSSRRRRWHRTRASFALLTACLGFLNSTTKS
jgi:hypothetical protein